MSDFKVEFKLKQHTPIIHFQSEQAGATLRATELKPKLDRFLHRTFPEEKIKQWRIESDKGALDYKVAIQQCGEDVQHLRYKTYINPKKAKSHERAGSYFGNSDALICKACIFKVTFQSFNTELISAIKENFESFLVVTNFGSRQNKGFGSFLPEDMTPERFESLLLAQKGFFFKKGHIQEPLRSINDDYQLLKSGKNKPYSKSLLFQFMCDDKIKWEKRMIKEKMKQELPEVFDELKWEHPPRRCDRETDAYRFYYIRGLLGIAGQVEFIKKKPTNFKDKIKVRITPQNSDISRYRSPVTFKVFGHTVYVFTEEQLSIGGERFTFSIDKKRLGEPLEVPYDFDLEAFLDFGLGGNLSYEKVNA
jgi:hypothetical protein